MAAVTGFLNFGLTIAFVVSVFAKFLPAGRGIGVGEAAKQITDFLPRKP